MTDILTILETEYTDVTRNRYWKVDPHFLKSAIDEIRALRKRVEELEKRLMIEVVPPDNMHIITEEQIDAAWKLNLYPYIDCAPEEIVEDVLEEIGIVRCEECGGSGKTQETIDPTMYGEPVHIFSSCKGCNGHRWVMKDESV